MKDADIARLEQEIKTLRELLADVVEVAADNPACAWVPAARKAVNDAQDYLRTTQAGRPTGA